MNTIIRVVNVKNIVKTKENTLTNILSLSIYTLYIDIYHDLSFA